jgi:hypothetical protein
VASATVSRSCLLLLFSVTRGCNTALSWFCSTALVLIDLCGWVYHCLRLQKLLLSPVHDSSLWLKHCLSDLSSFLFFQTILPWLVPLPSALVQAVSVLPVTTDLQGAYTVLPGNLFPVPRSSGPAPLPLRGLQADLFSYHRSLWLVPVSVVLFCLVCTTDLQGWGTTAPSWSLSSALSLRPLTSVASTARSPVFALEPVPSIFVASATASCGLLSLALGSCTTTFRDQYTASWVLFFALSQSTSSQASTTVSSWSCLLLCSVPGFAAAPLPPRGLCPHCSWFCTTDSSRG